MSFDWFEKLDISTVKPGSAFYYASASAIETRSVHQVQTTICTSVARGRVFFDNGASFSLENGCEIPKGRAKAGSLYSMTEDNRNAIAESVDRLALIPRIMTINWAALSLDSLETVIRLAEEDGAFPVIAEISEGESEESEDDESEDEDEEI